jgi:hypothetical protein
VTTRVSDSDPNPRRAITQQKNVHYNAAGVPPADAPRGFDMGGGQAGAPADDDHVPWSRPPGAATVILWSQCGPPRAGRPESRSRSGLRPGSGQEGQQGGTGAEQPEVEEGLRKSAGEPLRQIMQRLKTDIKSNEREPGI